MGGGNTEQGVGVRGLTVDIFLGPVDETRSELEELNVFFYMYM